MECGFATLVTECGMIEEIGADFVQSPIERKKNKEKPHISPLGKSSTKKMANATENKSKGNSIEKDKWEGQLRRQMPGKPAQKPQPKPNSKPPVSSSKPLPQGKKA